MRWFEKLESVFRISNYADVDRVKFASCTLQDSALTWWNSFAQSAGMDEAYATPWEEFKRMMIRTDITGYTKRFLELTLMCPEFVTTEENKIERYVWGLSEDIQGDVMSSKPRTLQYVIRMAHNLMDQVTHCQAPKATPNVKAQGNKSKWNENQGNSSWQKKNDKPKSKNTIANKNYNGKKPYCNRCYKHHYGAFTIVCDRCKKVGHMSKDCRVNLAQPTGNKPKTCYGCGQVGHMKNQCPNAKKDGNAKGRSFNISAKGAREDPELVTGTFLFNNCIAYMLFDSGADRNKIFRGCVLTLADTLFEVNLIHVELGIFDVIIGMDWLSKNHVDIACAEKAIRIPLANGETLVVQGDKSGTKLNIISCMKAQKCLRKGCQFILAHVKEIESEEKRLEDVPVVKDFPGVFPEDLPGLPPHREVEF
ncbi:uncharacterized protein [Rutidosis leptorrhynchoides]|uniref:uncharacterized protein n=1 Tax=Rutidosis leptorrhynchoides TaxID=125765 RepID=UPI003A9A2441